MQIPKGICFKICRFIATALFHTSLYLLPSLTLTGPEKFLLPDFELFQKCFHLMKHKLGCLFKLVLLLPLLLRDAIELENVCFFYNGYKRPLTPPRLLYTSSCGFWSYFWQFSAVFGGFRSSFGRFLGGPQNKSKVARTFL